MRKKKTDANLLLGTGSVSTCERIHVLGLGYYRTASKGFCGEFWCLGLMGLEGVDWGSCVFRNGFLELLCGARLSSGIGYGCGGRCVARVCFLEWMRDMVLFRFVFG